MPQWPWKNPRPGVDAYGRSQLWYSSADGDLAAVEQALRDGADPTAADKDGFGALHVAAQNGHAEIIDRLIEAGADVNCTDRYGNGPLWTACFNRRLALRPDGSFPIIAALLQAGANPDHSNNAGRSPASLVSEHLDELRSEFMAAGVQLD